MKGENAVKHPHYELIKAYYADPDAYTVLVQSDNGTWISAEAPAWNPNKNYRLVLKARHFLGHAFPRPLVSAPVVGADYYVPRITGDHDLGTMALRYTWEGDQMDYRYLERSMVHLNKVNAIEHARAMILASGGTFMPAEAKEDDNEPG